MIINIKKGVVVLIALILNGCLGMPDNVTPVDEFQLSRYLGQWYEIARLDHPFERGMSKVSANYSLNEDGTVKVVNRGFSAQDNEWNEAVGKAKFVNEAQQGYLKVSFFGPFYGSYIIFELDKENYNYAFVSGPDLSYLWLLSRTESVEPEVLEQFVSEAKRLGFNVDELIYVEH